MADWICEQCGGTFKRHRSRTRPIRFCNQKCYHAWRKDNEIVTGQFQKGDTPWNKGVKGIHLSPDTEFRRGRRPKNKAELGEVRIRIRKRDGKQRAWIKVGRPNKWRLRCYVLWEQAGGPKVPPDFFLHHCDGDTMNDTLTNLAVVSRAFHLQLHRPEFEEKRKLAARKARWGW